MNRVALGRDLRKIETIVSSGAWREAEAACLVGLRRHGRAAGLLRLLAMAREGAVGLERSLPDWAEAAKAGPADVGIQEAFAQRLDRLGRSAEACLVRFQLFVSGGRDWASVLELGCYLLRTDQTVSADKAYDALTLLEQAIHAAPQPAIPALTAANLALSFNRGNLAERILRIGLIHEPADANIWRMFGAVNMFQGRIAPADRGLSRTVTLSEDPRSSLMRAFLLEPVPASREAIAATRNRVDRMLDDLLGTNASVDYVENSNNLIINLFNLAYHGEDDRPLLEKAAAVFRRMMTGLEWQAPHIGTPRSADAPIRLAFIGSLQIDSVYRMIHAVISGLDPVAFDVTCYVRSAASKELETGRIGNADIVVLPSNVRQAREAVAAGCFDVVLYTDLFMDNLFYFMAFSRLGRVQCLWPGHPETSGLSSIDYFISTITLERPDADQDYTETLIRLPGLCMIYSRQGLTTNAVNLADYGLAPDARLYACSQTLHKLHPDFDRLLDEILTEDQEGIVVLFENSQPERTLAIGPRLEALKARHGDRLRVLPRLAMADYLGLMAQVTVVLDSLHFSGGNTTLQALELGLPIVTRPTRFMRGRATSSVYQLMGFTELIAETDECYVELAVKLARDATFRERCRAAIRARRDCLFDRMEVVDSYAALFRQLCGQEVGADPLPAAS